MSLEIDVYNELFDLIKYIPDVFDINEEFIKSRFKEITKEDEQKEVNIIGKIIKDNNLTSIDEALVDPEVRLQFINFITGDDDMNSNDIAEWAWHKVQSHMPTATVEDKFKTAWNYIKHFPALKKEMVEEMRRVGFTPKSNPFCVVYKMSDDKISKEEAKNKCIQEGKLNPMNAIAFEKRYHWEG